MMRRHRSRESALGLALLILMAIPVHGFAQYREAPPPPAYALDNVAVFHADGRREDGVSLVVRGGLVEAMGAGVRIPADATLLEGESLRVYPGIIDAHGAAPLEIPELDDPSGALPWDAPREVQGFTPHRMAAWYLTGAGPEGREARISGVIAAAVHPQGGMAPGQSAALLFRKGAGTPWETVARPNLGLHLTFRGARGVYPGTLFAVMAYFRQAFEDASRHSLLRSEYFRSPEGLPLPWWDPDYEVLNRAATGELPVYFAANSAGDIRRVLELADEIGFRPVIVGGEEAWEVSEALLARGIPVLVSVDFPPPGEWNPEERGEGAAAAFRESLEPGAAREKERLERVYANAARLVEAGITVALTSGGSGGDFREGVAKAMEYGLSEAEALKAVTSTPASLLGLPHLATIGQGMAANFIVTDGPLFHEGTAVRFTVVEGEVEKGAARPREGGAR